VRSVQRLLRTAQLMLYSLLPSRGGGGAPPTKEEAERCTPQQFRLGMERFLDGGGEFRVFFPDTLAAAGPFLLFRLKRRGFSRCSVKAADGGLYLQGRR
jgi:hypothetical protein